MLGLVTARLLAPVVLALGLAAAGCGGEPDYALGPTADCLADEGAAVERWEPGPDPAPHWTRPAPGGMLSATFDGQTAWAAFAADEDDAAEMAEELEGVEGLPGTFAGLMRPVIETDRNAVVYGFFPEGDELTPGFQAALDTVEGCLRDG